MIDSSTPAIERVVCVGVELKSTSLEELKESLAELEELVYAAGGEVVGSTYQSVSEFSAATLMGKGKLAEVKEMVDESEANLVVVDRALSGSQLRNLEKELEVAVLDRSQLILDIFAQRAKTYEGQLQVELAQMLDQLPRMVGGWLGSLSRQAGGIGTRGPGESALEIDRRRIRDRIDQIRKKLNTVRKNRSQHRAKRLKYNIPSFALIGYTNSGKSTLLNALTKSDVFSKDQVFATLDPTTRKYFLNESQSVVITDTVGFIRKLPTKLIEAFKATLEESEFADVLFHVIDLSSPQKDTHIRVVNELIEELGWKEKPILHIYNKVDLCDYSEQMSAGEHPRILISAKTGKGLDQIRDYIEDYLKSQTESVELFFPTKEEYKIYDLAREATVDTKEPASTGTLCKAHLTQAQIKKWKEYINR